MSKIFADCGGISTVPPIKDVKALGTNVYIEVLSAQETIRTKLQLPGSTEVQVNEGYVLHLGPRVPKEHGLEVGQRVFINGNISFAPNYGDYKFSTEGRKRGMVEYMAIKGHSVEEDE